MDLKRKVSANSSLKRGSGEWVFSVGSFSKPGLGTPKNSRRNYILSNKK